MTAETKAENIETEMEETIEAGEIKETKIEDAKEETAAKPSRVKEDKGPLMQPYENYVIEDDTFAADFAEAIELAKKTYYKKINPDRFDQLAIDKVKAFVKRMKKLNVPEKDVDERRKPHARRSFKIWASKKSNQKERGWDWKLLDPDEKNKFIDTVIDAMDGNDKMETSA
eukprot:CAMPEP_0198115726 /NCGR_PEP_ID=MMETSP1442-20131203/6805_1 /TAXON_ID= /ORGANISM="Craspedostauros australis, Strain CCMP3328" /LENGTH=170 /DNA_ID=CAMNT_0043773279 /DNA_START=71 /DNA_END=583 /DNA_ORIENTATION=+